MSTQDQNVAVATLLLLEQRLKRLDFYLGERAPPTAAAADDGNGERQDEASMASRVTRLERRLAEFCTKNPSASDVLKLQAQLPELDQGQGQSEGTHRSTSTQLPVILASEQDFQALNSQLTALQGQHLPDAKHLAGLVTLQPRITRAQAVYEQQSREVEELRRRSAAALAKRYEEAVLKGGEQWVEMEKRLSRMDLELRRTESALAREGAVEG